MEEKKQCRTASGSLCGWYQHNAVGCGGHCVRAGSWSCSRGEGTTSRRGLKPVYIIYILKTHTISESVAWMKDTGWWDSLDKERDGPWNKLRYQSKTFYIEVTSLISKYLRYLRYSVKKLRYRSVWVWDTISKCWLQYRSFWKILDIAYTTSISKCFDIGCYIQFQCTSISKFLSLDIEVLWYRVRY